MNGMAWRMGVLIGIIAAGGGAVADDAPVAAQPAAAPAVPAAEPVKADAPAKPAAPEPPAEPAKPISGMKPADLAKAAVPSSTPAAVKAAPAKPAEGGVKGTVAVGDAKPAEYPDLAKIQLQYAIRAAMTKVQGKLLKVELESAGGFLVWEVEIVKSDKTIYAAKVDAGTGAVLAVDRDEPEDDDK